MLIFKKDHILMEALSLLYVGKHSNSWMQLLWLSDILIAGHSGRIICLKNFSFFDIVKTVHFMNKVIAEDERKCSNKVKGFGLQFAESVKILTLRYESLRSQTSHPALYELNLSTVSISKVYVLI